MAEFFQVRDPVHHFITLTDKEVELIGTQIFQRLRGISQLAMANLLYPGALHTRFDHSLGVCHVAGLLSKQLGLNDDDIRVIRLAALLHDLGHGPFSHVSEYALDLFTDRDKLPPELKKEKIHEVITGNLIHTDSEILRILGKSDCEKIKKLLIEGYSHKALRDIVSGPLDADKQDYLLRDSYFCGVPYGLFDIHQFHRSLVLGGEDENKELMISPDGIHAVEQYVLAKYYMTSIIYRHRVRLITDQMLMRAIVLGIEEDGIDKLRKIYSFDHTDDFLENYKFWDDKRFLLTFGSEENNNTLCGQIIDRLLSRKLLKRVFSRKINKFDDAEVRETIQSINEKENSKRRKFFEKEIAELLNKQVNQNIDKNFVVVNAFTIRSVRTTSRDDEAQILVYKKPNPVPFVEESTLLSSIDERYSETYVEVYAPVEWTTPKDKTEIRDKLRQPIINLMELLVKEDKNDQ